MALTSRAAASRLPSHTGSEVGQSGEAICSQDQPNPHSRSAVPREETCQPGSRGTRSTHRRSLRDHRQLTTRRFRRDFVEPTLVRSRAAPSTLGDVQHDAERSPLELIAQALQTHARAIAHSRSCAARGRPDRPRAVHGRGRRESNRSTSSETPLVAPAVAGLSTKGEAGDSRRKGAEASHVNGPLSSVNAARLVTCESMARVSQSPGKQTHQL